MRDQAKALGLTISTDTANGVVQHDVAQELLAEGVAEGVVRTEYCGVASQIRLDWLNPHLGIVDLKTADEMTNGRDGIQ